MPSDDNSTPQDAPSEPASATPERSTSSNPSRRPLSDAQKGQILELRSKGVAYSKIAEEVGGCSVATVGNVCRKSAAAAAKGKRAFTDVANVQNKPPGTRPAPGSVNQTAKRLAEEHRKKRIFGEHVPTISASTITRILEENGLTRRKGGKKVMVTSE